MALCLKLIRYPTFKSWNMCIKLILIFADSIKTRFKSIYYTVNCSVAQIAIGKNDNLYCIILHQFDQNQVIGIWGTVKHIK